MKKLFVPFLLLGLLTPLRTYAQAGGNLAGVLSKQGLAGAKLERRYGNHLFVSVSINNRHGALLIDTGSPNTLIVRNSVNTFGLTMEKTDSTVGGLFGRSWERYGTSKVKSIAMGNCMLTNVPVAIADLSGMNPEHGAAATGSHISDSKAMAHLSGVLGARDMVKFGMVIDCTRQMLYINPNGASSAVSHGLVEGVNRTRVKELGIGNFKLANAEVVVAHVSGDILLSQSAAESNAGVLGQDYLSTNFAVIDMGGRALYLRHPDSR